MAGRTMSADHASEEYLMAAAMSSRFMRLATEYRLKGTLLEKLQQLKVYAG